MRRKIPSTLTGREAEFTEVWMTPTLTGDAVARALRCSRDSAYFMAKTLGLPTRTELREAAGLPLQGAISSSERSAYARYGADRQLARLEACLAAEDTGPPPVDRNYCFVCSGPCPLDVLGHPSCTGRRAA